MARREAGRSFMKVGVCALLCISLTMPAFAQSDEKTLVLTPTSKWVVDYENEGCQLMRQFGDGEDRVILSMSRYAPGTGFKMTLSGRPIKQSDAGEVTLRFGPNEKEQKRQYLPGTLADKFPAMIISDGVSIAPRTFGKPDPKTKAIPITEGYSVRDEARERAVTFLHIGRPVRRPIRLELGPMDKPFGALEKCVHELLSHWGIDVEKHKTLKRAAYPKGNPGNWVNTSDYPIKMLNEGQPAVVEFRMDIDEKGKAVGCHIQQTTRPKEFDSAVCDSLMRRAKFEPALDAEGIPLRSYWKSTVRFMLPW